MGLIQKIAVITGAVTGVGQSCTLALLSEGYSVVLAGRRENRLKETVEKAGEFKKNTFVVQTDVSEQNSVKSLLLLINIKLAADGNALMQGNLSNLELSHGPSILIHS